MAITPEDLITKSFKIVTEESGYDRNEVDDFLDELVVELRALYSERDALERQVEQLSANAPDSPAAAVAPAQSSAAPAAAPQDAAALLAMAQKVHDDYVAQGEKAKAELIEEAERKAERYGERKLSSSAKRFSLASPTRRKSWRSLLRLCAASRAVTAPSCCSTWMHRFRS